MMQLSILSVIRHLICFNNWNWLLNLNLIYETLWTWAGSGFLISMLEKLQLVSIDWYDTTGAIDVKMDGSVVEEKSSFKLLELTFSSKLDLGCSIISIAKTASKKIGALKLVLRKFFLSSFFLQWLLSISINLPLAHAWIIVVTSGLVCLVATWNCLVSYENGYAGLLFFHFLLLLNPWLIVDR